MPLRREFLAGAERVPLQQKQGRDATQLGQPRIDPREQEPLLVGLEAADFADEVFGPGQIAGRKSRAETPAHDRAIGVERRSVLAVRRRRHEPQAQALRLS